MKTLIAVDPGTLGAIAVRDADGRVYTERMPETPAELLWTLRDMRQGVDSSVLALVERVGTYRPGNSGPAAAKFARHVGHIEMALAALAIPQARPVAPQVWQRAVCGALPSDKADRKRAVRDLMQRRFPELRVTQVTADALGLLCFLQAQGEVT